MPCCAAPRSTLACAPVFGLCVSCPLVSTCPMFSGSFLTSPTCCSCDVVAHMWYCGDIGHLCAVVHTLLFQFLSATRSRCVGRLIYGVLTSLLACLFTSTGPRARLARGSWACVVGAPLWSQCVTPPICFFDMRSCTAAWVTASFAAWGVLGDHFAGSAGMYGYIPDASCHHCCGGAVSYHSL